MEAFAEAGAIFTPNQFAGAVHAELTSLTGIRNTALERANITTDPGVVGRLCGMHVTWGDDDGFLGRKMTHTDGRAYSYYELLWNWMTGQQPVNVIAPKPPETPEVPRPDAACRNGAPNVASPVVATASSASYDFQAPVTPDSIAVTFGSNLAAAAVTTSTIPWPTALGGVQIAVRDAASTVRQAPIYFVSPSQVLYLIPAGTVPGTAEITIGAQRFNVQVTATSPSIYAANQAGTGVAAASFLRVRSGQQTTGLLFDPMTNAAIPIGARAGDQVYLLLYGTGMRGGPATATVGGVNVPVAGPVAQSQYPGLDQINLGPLPLAIGAGLKEIVIRQGERTSNPVTVTFRRE
jgi:uncharacterized protein (TIGR03437 family)